MRCKAHRALTALLILLPAAVGCRQSRPPATAPTAATPAAPPAAAPVPGDEGPPTDGTFAYVSFEPEFIDPARISESAGAEIAQNLFESLLSYPPGTGEPQPGVASRYDVSADGRVYTFKLRPEARWSDGRPLTAHDVRWSWLRKLAPETASKSAEHLWFIEGARRYNQGQVKDVDSVAIKAVDPHTLVVTLEHPHVYFKWHVAGPHYAPTPRHVVERYGDRWTRPEHIVTNGPYVLEEWKLRDRVVLAKNPHYWGADDVAIERAVIYATTSETTAVQWYESGKVHWVPGMVPLEKVRAFRAAQRPDFHVVPLLCVYYYAFRTDKAPFDDARVRRAFNRAIDKERLVQHVLGGGQEPATHLVPAMFAAQGYQGPAGEEFDPEAARALLTEAGYPRGVGLPPVEIVYNTFEAHRVVAEFVQRNLKENLGIDVSIRNMEWKSLLKKLQAGDFQLARFGWCGLNDPFSFVKITRGDSPNNHLAYRNPALDELLVNAAKEPDVATRNGLIHRAEEVINRDQPLLPLYFYTRPYLLKPYVCGFEDNTEDVHLLKYLRFASDCGAAQTPPKGSP